MQPAPSGPSLVCRYGAFTYGRIGTHDKSMFGLPLCQMPGERKMERETQIKRMREKEEGERKRERERDSLLPLCSFHRLQISDPRDTLPAGDISEQKFVARH